MSINENNIEIIPFPTEEFMNNTGLFWQYPVITEKTFYLQNKKDPYCLIIPWATIIDFGFNLSNLFKIIDNYKNKSNSNNYYTCCQHIYYRKIIPICKLLGICKIYSPHKVKGLDFIEDIEILPCPLYAVNYEDDTRNSTFKNIDFELGFYFVHSYFFQPLSSNNILGTTFYGEEFTSAVFNDNIFGVQFHPEKSQAYGINFLKRFLEWQL
mgnify:CR=1 FL=1